MTTLSTEDIQKIAELAKLSISENTLIALTADLTNILNLAEKMNVIDTHSIEPLAHSIDTSQSLRQDVVTETNQRALFQSIAPETESGLYLVPKFMQD